VDTAEEIVANDAPHRVNLGWAVQHALQRVPEQRLAAGRGVEILKFGNYHEVKLA
jgi:hypothetical protein